MNHPRRRLGRAILIGLVGALVAAFARMFTVPLMGTTVPFITFFPAIIAVSVWGGTEAGWACLVGSILLAPAWMGGQPYGLGRQDWINLVAFSLISAGIILAVRQGHRAERQQDILREKLLRSEQEARSAAERASLLKDEFLATLSHELRSPLNAILGWIQLLRSGSHDPRSVTEAVTVIERNARAQARIIEDLLEMSRIISGKMRLDVQPTDLSGVIEAALASVQPAAEAKAIRIMKVIDPMETISGDPERLQQVPWNLLGNAIKFSPKGEQVSLVARRMNTHVEISVSDTGKGIDPEFLPYVFDRFRQESNSQKRSHGGLGLGLSIAKHLVEMHGGTIEARSDGIGKGACFVLTLPLTPLRPDTGDQAARLGVGDGRVAPVKLNGVRVLVVEDDRDSLDLICRFLRACSADVAVASSAQEALGKIEGVKPDVLISDIGMAGKDGIEMLKEIRSQPTSVASTPAIALTAFARAEDRARAILAGFQVHLAKPVEARELVAAVANLAGVTGATGASPSNGKPGLEPEKERG